MKNDETPLEWLPPEDSPRLKSWKPINFSAWLTLAARISSTDPGISAPLHSTIQNLRLSWQRLHDDYLEWFVPEGPPGTHAHVHYGKPRRKKKQQAILAAMAVDYESALGYLYTAVELTARGLGLLVGRPVKDWSGLVKLAEDPGSWLPEKLRAAIRQLQRGALFTRSKAIVHPGRHYAVTRWDNTGNVTHIRLPVDPPSKETIADLDEMWHRLQPVRDGLSAGTNIAPWQVMQLLDTSAALLNDADRERLFEFRQTIGFTYPGANVIGPTVDAILEEIAALVPPE